MKKTNAYHGPPLDAYIIPDTDEHQVGILIHQVVLDIKIKFLRYNIW